MLLTNSKAPISVLPLSYKVYSFFLDLLILMIPRTIRKIYIETNEVEVNISRNFLLEFFKFIKIHTWTQFKVLSDIIAIDYPGRNKRFDVIYQLLSIAYNSRMNILVSVGELSVLPSISSVYKGASWYEREVWDLFGIFFEGHPDLRRIVTDYSFEGHPLRKDFPLTGYFEVFYDDTRQLIEYAPVSLVQEYRYFTFSNPWLNT